MKNLITELDIINYHKKGGSILPVGENDVLTPSAIDRAKQLQITIIKKEEADKIRVSNQGLSKFPDNKRVSVGCDHTGLKIKNIIAKILIDKGYEVIDVGTYDESSCDYADFAHSAAIKVCRNEADFAVIIDATGIPSAITANKIKGIRAATCYNEFSARSAREHNNANVLVLGAKALGEESIKSILDVWLNTAFGGGRHQKRLDKITSLENQNFK